MSNENAEHGTDDLFEPAKPSRGESANTWSGPRKRWVPVVVLIACMLAAAGLTWLLITIFDHKQEAERPFTEVVELTDQTYDPAVWGRNFPLQYESYLQTEDSGAQELQPNDNPSDPNDPRMFITHSKLEEYPRLVTMWQGYAFSKEYREPRGHQWMLTDQRYVRRITEVNQPGTCLNCHASMPEIYAELGNGDQMAGFAAMNKLTYGEAVQHARGPIACIDCHDPQTMQLRITRPAFIAGIRAVKASQGIMDYDVNRDATTQEMRAYVCAQCHVEYYFAPDGNTLTFPWRYGLTAYDAIRYYDEIGWTDFQHAQTGAPVLKAQHPDFDTWSQGIHAANGVTCADCHMAYQRNGAAKVSNHQIMSPMANDETINASCLTCHHSTEAEMRQRVEKIQTTWQSSLNVSFTALEGLINDIKAAEANGTATEEQLTLARDYQRKAQFVVDYSFSENGRGFHAPQYSVSMLNQATDWARSGQLALRGVSVENGVPPAIPEKHMPNKEN